MLELEHVHKSYSSPGEKIRAVDDVSMTVEAREFIAIFGPSGSGKSTLLSLAAGLIEAESGTVRFDGVDIGALSKRETFEYRRTKLGNVFQSFNLTAGLKVTENVAIPLLVRGVPRAEARVRAREALNDVGLSMRADHRPDQLSGGEQQRVAIARALVGKPKLILADEPTGNLDSSTGSEVLELMSEMTRSYGASAIVVTHDPTVAGFADRVLWMRDGRLGDPEAATSPIAAGE
jgi:putative ABC transport system ATP-binding protein